MQGRLNINMQTERKKDAVSQRASGETDGAHDQVVIETLPGLRFGPRSWSWPVKNPALLAF